MAHLTSLTKESVKSLGPGAYLVSVLPSVLVVLIILGLSASSLYPWSQPRMEMVDGRQTAVPDGLPAIIAAARHLNAGEGAALVLVVLVVAALLRPFHIAAVQLLEGYWTRSRFAFLQALTTERHRRRRSMAWWNKYGPRDKPRRQSFKEVAHYLRQEARRKRRSAWSRELLSHYPRDSEQVLPTLLGNVLRRAETSAGERYGLATVLSYPRLYQHLSQRLEGEINNQVRLLDASAAFVLVFAVAGVISMPIIWRPDAWLLLPITFLLAALVAYRGALRAARLYAELLHTAYDLHRFDMIKSMHRRLPETPGQEDTDNKELTAFLFQGQFGEKLPTLQTAYDHSKADPAMSGAGSAPPPLDGDSTADAKNVNDGDTVPPAG
jgi:hypothetical protein